MHLDGCLPSYPSTRCIGSRYPESQTCPNPIIMLEKHLPVAGIGGARAFYCFDRDQILSWCVCPEGISPLGNAFQISIEGGLSLVQCRRITRDPVSQILSPFSRSLAPIRHPAAALPPHRCHHHFAVKKVAAREDSSNACSIEPVFHISHLSRNQGCRVLCVLISFFFFRPIRMMMVSR